jgi:hypothetical protein
VEVVEHGDRADHVFDRDVRVVPRVEHGHGVGLGERQGLELGDLRLRFVDHLRARGAHRHGIEHRQAGALIGRSRLGESAAGRHECNGQEMAELHQSPPEIYRWKA